MRIRTIKQAANLEVRHLGRVGVNDNEFQRRNCTKKIEIGFYKYDI